MADVNSDDLIEKLDRLQKTVWDIDEKTRRNLESISRQQIDIAEIMNTLSVIKEKLVKLENGLMNIKDIKEVANDRKGNN